MNFYKLLFFFFISISFFSCQSKIDFLVEDEVEPESECLEKEKEIDGQVVCLEEKVEIFTVGELSNKWVDFLFVLDVSPSMTDDLARLGQSFESLMSRIIKSNWRMFFTTADHGDHVFNIAGNNEKIFTQQKWEDYQGTEPVFGHFMNLEHGGKVLPQKYLDMSLPNYIDIFKDTLTRSPDDGCERAPYCQGALEQPLRVLNSVLERVAQDSSSGVRKPADIVSFIVTDEDERKEDSQNATTAEDVVQTANKLFPTKKFSAFSVLIQDEGCLKQQMERSEDSVYGTKVSELAKLTGGKSISLCEEDYGPPLQELSALLRSIIEGFSLKEEPISTADVKVEVLNNKKTISTKWKLVGKQMVFEGGLEPGLQVKVSYFVKREVKE